MIMANKIVNGKQCTILWHVDDLKISHENENVVSASLDEMNEHVTPLVVSQGKSMISLA
jgi:hypothetical protein